MPALESTGCKDLDQWDLVQEFTTSETAKGQNEDWRQLFPEKIFISFCVGGEKLILASILPKVQALSIITEMDEK